MRKFLFFLSFILVIAQRAHAKNDITYPDAGMWSTLSIDYALNKRWAILFCEELRLRENYSRLNLLYTNIGMEFNGGKHFKTSLVYRNIERQNLDNSFTIRHRLMWDATLRTKYKRWSLAYRHRLQVEYRAIQSSNMGKIPEWYSRHKFELGYQYNKRLSPYAAVELRYQLHDPRNMVSDQTWHRVRYQLGFDYRVNKFSKVGLYYLMQRVFNVSNYENLYITGIEYGISLSDMKYFNKKKK